jgi:hypothetical protein
MTDYISSDRFLDVGELEGIVTDPETKRTALLELVDMGTGDTTPILAVMRSDDEPQRIYFYTEQP